MLRSITRITLNMSKSDSTKIKEMPRYVISDDMRALCQKVMLSEEFLEKVRMLMRR